MTHNRINITLPAETIEKLDTFAAKGERSRFINEAIHAYISQIERKQLQQRIKEGAIARGKRDLNLADDWFAIEEEEWQQNQA